MLPHSCGLSIAKCSRNKAADCNTVLCHQRPLGAHGGVQKQPTALYIKNLPADADKLYLYERFARFGAILSVKVWIPTLYSGPMMQ